MNPSAWPFGHLRLFGYDVVMIDCPWEWEAYGDGGYAKSPEAQYSTMLLREIARLPVGHLLRAGGLCVVWCTWPLIGRQSAIVEGDYLDPATGERIGWGLRVKTGGAWAKRTTSGKLRWGPGYIIRSVCEPFLICTIGDEHGLRGRSSINLIETVAALEDLCLDGVAREHSRKPQEAYDLFEAIAGPDVWRADVFTRETRPGWDAFGFEAAKFNAMRAAATESKAASL